MTLSATDLTFTWPDGDTAIAHLTTTLRPGLTGLVGANGAGKSTLARLLAGELTPTAGIVTGGRAAYLPQDLTLDTTRRVDEILGVRGIRDAIQALADGTGDATRHLEVIGDEWDIEERSLALLTDLGLSHVDLDRTVGTLSGGEATLLGIAATLLPRPPVAILDEPTNNLDAPARARLLATLRRRQGATVVITHDRAILDDVDQVAELRDGRLRWLVGPFAAYRGAIDAEQDAARETVANAAAALGQARKAQQEAQAVAARSRRYGRKQEANSTWSKAAADAKRRSAQESAGKRRAMHEERVEAARERLDEAEALVRDDEALRIVLPETEVPASRDVLIAEAVVPDRGPTLDLHLRGPERLAVTGPNGSGKTTLLHTLLGRIAPASGEVRLLVPATLVPQRLTLLEPGESVVDAVGRYAAHLTPGEVRSALARFLFRGRSAERLVADLSGGELLRATLGAVLLARPAPQLLVLDEPTNNLDLASREHLAQALAAYRGALLIVSHDEAFLAELGLDARLEPDGESWQLRPEG